MDSEYGEAPVDNWIPSYTIEEIPKADRWRNILSQEEISELLTVLDDLNKEDIYAAGSAWQHKDGNMYEIIKKEKHIIYEPIDETLTISRNLDLIWYRVRFADRINGEVFVRTRQHFEDSFTWVPESDLM